MEFAGSSSYSLGVEIEFQILDRQNLDLAPFVPLLLEQAPSILQPRLSLGLITSILEVQTGVCADLRDVENDLLQTCSLAEELAIDNGFLLYASSLHPLAVAAEQELSEHERYGKIMQELQIVGRRFIAQGLHVHVGLPDGETAVKVCNVIQAFLPLFLALSCSSPFYQGKDSGLMSCRTMLFEALPLAGNFAYMSGWQQFVDEVEQLKRYGIIGGFRDLWWDARPHPEFGTIEVRICDLPIRFTAILAMVALIQSTVAWLAEEVADAEPFNSSILKANKWQAVRYGLEGRFVDPSALLADQPMPLRLAAMALKRSVAPAAKRLRCEGYLEQLDSFTSAGTGADLMRRIHRKTGDLRRVIREVQKDFWL